MEPFTEEQMQILMSNRYTYSLTKHRIQYTLEFKQYVMKELAEGNTSVNIFIKAGYDPEILSVQRIYTFVKRLKIEAASSEGLKPPKEYKQARDFAKKKLEEEKTSTAIKELQNQIVYLEQEVEFLKKISSIKQKYLPDE